MRISSFIMAGAAGLSIMLNAGAAAASGETVLYSFTDGADGGCPFAGVTEDSAGNFYGATQLGAAANLGAIFKLSKKGVLTPLHAFTGGADGGIPQGTPILHDNVLFGTSQGSVEKGSKVAGGAIYAVTTTGTETTLATLTEAVGKKFGEGPSAGLLRVGTEYFGVAEFAGDNGTGSGTVFKIDAAGQIRLLHVFAGGSDGAFPFGTLVADTSGNMYGTTYGGGANDDGTIFKVTPRGDETVLYSFGGGTDGSEPIGGLVFDAQGNLYGTTLAGGTYNNGTVFELPAGGTEKVLYAFLGGFDGASPYGTLVFNGGQLIGTTSAGGGDDAGTVFTLMPGGVDHVIYSFTGGADGMSPYGGLMMTKAGDYIGTTCAGGVNGYGTVFEIVP